MDHYINCHRVQCCEPTALALDNFRCFSLISTAFAVVNVIASNFRFQCNWSIPYMPVGSKLQNIGFYRKVHNFQMMINVFKASNISYNLVSIEY